MGMGIENFGHEQFQILRSLKFGPEIIFGARVHTSLISTRDFYLINYLKEKR